MAIKLFVTDMDGTLLNSQHIISEENKQAVQEAAAAGVTVTIATGRAYSTTLDYAKELGVDVPIITYNGALIRTVKGKELFASYLEPAVVEDVLRYSFSRDWYVQLYNHTENSDHLYIEKSCEFSNYYEVMVGAKGDPVGREGMLHHCSHVPKMLVMTKGDAETKAVLAELQSVFGNRIFPVQSNEVFAEISGENVNKGAAVLHLAGIMGIKADEIMVIGDSHNDLPMMKVAGKRVAMGNADETVKNICDYLTSDCDADGVAAALRKYVLKQ